MPGVLSHQFISHTVEGDVPLQSRSDKQLMVSRNVG
jgi:hypothetical protein